MADTTVQAMLDELDGEAAATRRLLERVPGDKLGWRPHPRSMTLGELALHVAGIPGVLAGLLEQDDLNVTDVDFTPPSPESAEQLLGVLDDALAAAHAQLGSWDDATAQSEWTLRNGDQTVFTVPRAGLARTLMLNHWYHHRGQLTVYLRLLDVDVPATYGRSADENPFG